MGAVGDVAIQDLGWVFRPNDLPCLYISVLDYILMGDVFLISAFVRPRLGEDFYTLWARLGPFYFGLKIWT